MTITQRMHEPRRKFSCSAKLSTEVADEIEFAGVAVMFDYERKGDVLHNATMLCLLWLRSSDREEVVNSLDLQRRRRGPSDAVLSSCAGRSFREADILTPALKLVVVLTSAMERMSFIGWAGNICCTDVSPKISSFIKQGALGS